MNPSCPYFFNGTKRKFTTEKLNQPGVLLFFFWGGNGALKVWEGFFFCVFLWENLVRRNSHQPKLFKKPHKNGGGRRFCWKDGRIFELSFFCFFNLNHPDSHRLQVLFAVLLMKWPLTKPHDFLGVATGCTKHLRETLASKNPFDASNNCTFFDRTCFF